MKNLLICVTIFTLLFSCKKSEEISVTPEPFNFTGVLIDGKEVHIFVTAEFYGRWAVLFKHVLVWVFALKDPIVVEIDATMFAVQLPSATGNAVYRVADEALRNVEQHSHAKHARVVLRAIGDVTVEIEDDGRGFDMRAIDPLQAGLGLFSAQAVLALAGGELQISSAPGLGTRVVARVPLDPPIERS